MLLRGERGWTYIDNCSYIDLFYDTKYGVGRAYIKTCEKYKREFRGKDDISYFYNFVKYVKRNK